MENVNLIKKNLNWDEKNIHILMAIARDKENKEDNANRLHRKTVRREDELEESIDYLKRICDEDVNYRLYISVNSRDCVKASTELKKHIDDTLLDCLEGNGSFQNLKKLDSDYKSILQKNKCKSESRFLFDVDNSSEKYVNDLVSELRKKTEVIFMVETPNGYHVVTEPNNLFEFGEWDDVEVKKDDMVYIGRF